jgi:hypothetical protein
VSTYDEDVEAAAATLAAQGPLDEQASEAIWHALADDTTWLKGASDDRTRRGQLDS